MDRYVPRKPLERAAARRRLASLMATLSLIGATMVAGSNTARAGVFPLFVDNTVACDDSTVDSTVTPYCTIQAAVDDVTFSGLIDVSAGTYTGAGTEVVAISSKDITIIGAGSKFTTIDAEDGRRGFLVNGGSTVELQGLTIANGSFAGGAGISVFGSSSLTLTNAKIFSSDSSSTGGGISIVDGSLTLDNASIQENTAITEGGGVTITGSTAVTIVDSQFIGNTAGSGGAMLFVGGSLDIDGSWFEGNDAATSGGAIDLMSPSAAVTIEGSTFKDNGLGTAAAGGALYSQNGGFTVTGSTFVGNASSGGGGAIALGSGFTEPVVIAGSNFLDNTSGVGGAMSQAAPAGPVSIVNSTFSGNDASDDGGALFGVEGTIATSTFHLNTAGDQCGAVCGNPTVNNTILSGNTAVDAPTGNCDLITSDGYNLVNDSTCQIIGDHTGELRNVDPLLGPLADNGGPTKTHAIGAASPARNAGNPAAPGSGGSACPATDQRGVPRDDGACDIGAYEFVDSEPPVISGVPTNITVDATGPLGAVVDYANPTAVDAVDGPVAVGCVPASGSLFPIGATTVTCTATDTSANEATEQFTVTVLDMAFDVLRYAGANRYGTAAAISVGDSPDPGLVDTVFVAVGTNFPDALAGAAVAGKLGAPLLLVQTDSIPAETAAELTRLGPATVVILGGTAVVSPAVETALGGYAAAVIRLAGPNRYATAVEISKHGFPGTADTVIIATGLGFADALAGGPAAVSLNGPVLLTDPNNLPAVVSAEITRLGPSRIIVVGGTAVVSNTVVTQLEALAPDVDRIAGPNRYQTAVAISLEAFAAGAARAYVATGLNFPDALAGAAAAGSHGAPILLVPGTSLPGAVAAEITRLGATTIVILGGTAVVSTSVETDLETLLGI